MLATVLYFL